MDWLPYIIKPAPAITVFAALALGHALRRFKIARRSRGGGLKLDPVILPGAIGGAPTAAAALSDATEAAHSMTPVPGFTVSYAIPNMLLAVRCPPIGACT